MKMAKWDDTEHGVRDPESEVMLYQHARPDRSHSSMMIGLLLGFGGLCCILATAILMGWV